jgi:hypothetical protein
MKSVREFEFEKLKRGVGQFLSKKEHGTRVRTYVIMRAGVVDRQYYESSSNLYRQDLDF